MNEAIQWVLGGLGLASSSADTDGVEVQVKNVPPPTLSATHAATMQSVNAKRKLAASSREEKRIGTSNGYGLAQSKGLTQVTWSATDGLVHAAE